VKQTDLDDSKKMSIRGSVADREGQGVRNIKVQIRAWDWWAVSVTDAQGQYSFDGLVNPVTYTLTLFDRPCVPVNAPGVWGKTTWVDFQEAG
jgi:protocatechuate 3,4-dioxygenase beta subunit